MLLENIALGKTLEVYVDRDGYRYRLVSKVEKTGVKRVCLTAIMAGEERLNFARRITYVWFTAVRIRCGNG